MKILLVNHTLAYYAGSETFTYALALELTRLGHDVTCFSPRLGKLAERLAEQGIPVVGDLADGPDHVDIIHSHHRHESLLAFARYPHTPMILVCHGVLPWQEQPLKARLNIHRYVAVSEEIRDHLIRDHGIAAGDIVILRNGVDLERFDCRVSIAPRPRQALVLSNYMPDSQRELVRRVCGRLGIAVREIGRSRSVWNVEEEINRADVVFGLGRSALEAMACKRVVVVYDYNGGDGLVTPGRFALLRRRNFSGRTFGKLYTEEELAEEILAYDPAIPEELYVSIKAEHDLRRMARQYTALYAVALAEARQRTPSTQEVGVRQHAAVQELLADAASLRAELEAVRQSRGWQALAAVRRMKDVIWDRLRIREPLETHSRPRILVIDDDPFVSQWLADALAADGHDVALAENGLTALDLIRETRFDLILSDLRMPELDGVTLYQELERQWPSVAQRVIFVTGNGEDPAYQPFLARLDGRTLAKPLDLEALSQLIRRSLSTPME
jgi:CheY-like chemotaxis protein